MPARKDSLEVRTGEIDQFAHILPVRVPLLLDVLDQRDFSAELNDKSARQARANRRQ